MKEKEKEWVEKKKNWLAGCPPSWAC